MGQDVRNDSRVCRTPPGPPRNLNLYLRPNPILVAVSLTFILMTSGLVYYLMLPLPSGDDGGPDELTPHAAIAIDGDANFIATALLEGWLGDGSPENPFIINGLDIDLGDGEGNCIMISNTRVSFTISNCNLTGANHAADGELIWWSPGDDFELPRHEMNKGAGIHLDNVSNGELVSNTCNNNSIGIDLFYVDSNTVSSNNCTNNGHGIVLWGSDSNTVTNNTCNSNTECAIYLYDSYSNIVEDNTCLGNTGCGIYLNCSFLNMLVNNTCNENGYSGISVSWFPGGGGLRSAPPPNTVEDNTCNENGHSGICLTSLEQSTV
ncbi:MAG: right-handed parallel beta-helix repeat-containing protein, partial [Promethearchaeota archaeon]